jgi:predicted RNase H-like nuclease (RuvC/YqgF family)
VTADDGETAAIIMSLRQKLKAQTDEVVTLQSKLSSIAKEHKSEKDTLVSEVQSLSEQVASLSSTLQTAETGREGHGAELEKLTSTHAAELDKLSKELEERHDRSL